MTSNNGKLRALFLAALMVLSITVGSIAFAGGAAAAAQSVSETSTGPYAPGDSVDFDVEAGSNTNTITVWVDDDGNGQYDDEPTVEVTPSEAGETVSGTVAVASDASTAPDTATLAAVESASADLTSGTTSPDVTSGTFEIDATAPSTSDSAVVDASTVTVSFDEEVNSLTNGDGFSLADDDTDAEISVSSVSGNGTDTLTLSLAEPLAADDSHTPTIAGGTVEDVLGNTADGKLTATSVTYTTGGFDPAANYWQGEEFDYTGLEADAPYTIERVIETAPDGSPTDTEFVRERYADSSGKITIDTEGLQGKFVLRGDGIETTAPGDVWQVAPQDLSIEADDGEVQLDNSEELTIESERGSWSMDVTASGLDDSELESLFEGTDGFTVADASVTDDEDGITLTDVRPTTYDLTPDTDNIDTGEYNLEFEVPDSGVEESLNISVTEGGEGSVSLATSSVEVAQGDVAAITVELSETDEGTLLIGNHDDDGYQLNMTVTDDGDDQVTVYFDTDAAGQSNDVWVDTADEDDEYTVESSTNDWDELTSVLDTGNYELATVDGNYQDAMDEPDDVGTLYVSERSTDSLATWTASSSNAGDLESVSDVSSAVEDGTLTESSEFAIGSTSDKMVTQISATGLEGLVMEDEDSVDEDGVVTKSDFTAALESYYEGDTYDSASGFSLALEQLNPGSNQDANTFDFDSNTNAIDKVFYDGEGNWYVVVDIDTVSSNLGGSGDGEMVDGDEYELSFDLQDSHLLDASGDWDDDGTDVYESLTTEFSVADADAEFDVSEVDGDDYVVAEAAENQTVSGTTNIAPGTEVRVRLTGTGDATFVESNTEVVVQEDGTFSTTFDLSERAAGEEFEATVRGGPLPTGDNLVTADGLIQEAQPTQTTTEQTTEQTTTETTETTTEEPADTTTEAPADTTTEAPTETPTETPGFTMGLALVALLGAALLALRRSN
ncbi:PGF-CTERM sorting domain-containing protein [Halodesulfurarchaeum sp. HSR-GB]|uniref:DUF7827 domain-containing protein n=1 Tax=Halodesulfurarchaeum sp. HSR-GB TaxID=3074077 RepID=UPI002861C8C3|nr:BGTF surface domain-containing protein [Halodesulfurarchaeum sp. HSR-GB]MDR5656682.1 PGF-CTERM sorting domain-containing protein [Halodesulfurarchaeum sp. HSR-GB]